MHCRVLTHSQQACIPKPIVWASGKKWFQPAFDFCVKCFGMEYVLFCVGERCNVGVHVGICYVWPAGLASGGRT